MNKDTLALVKFGVCVAIVAVLLVVWFNTVGAPQPEEEEELAEVILTSAGIL